MSELSRKRCVPCEGGATPLTDEAAHRLLEQVDGWTLEDATQHIERDFSFDDFHQTMAFVNAVAWIAHREDHHPDLEVGYRHCRVRYTTHAIQGLSENDFICAARIDELIAGR